MKDKNLKSKSRHLSTLMAFAGAIANVDYNLCEDLGFNDDPATPFNTKSPPARPAHYKSADELNKEG